MKDSLATLVYALVLGLAAAALLTGVAHLTHDRREQNQEAERKRAILDVLGVPFDANAPAGRLLEVFGANVTVEPPRTEEGLRFFCYTDPGTRRRVKAVRFAGMGRNGLIEGYLALDEDLRVVRGIRFFKHDETPGLGGEISALEFCGRFVGKCIESPAGEPGIAILRPAVGKAAARNEVDGISGASMTCQRVEDILRRIILRIIREREDHGQ